VRTRRHCEGHLGVVLGLASKDLNASLTSWSLGVGRSEGWWYMFCLDWCLAGTGHVVCGCTAEHKTVIGVRNLSVLPPILTIGLNNFEISSCCCSVHSSDHAQCTPLPWGQSTTLSR
jgi:hypothetical protein